MLPIVCTKNMSRVKNTATPEDCKVILQGHSLTLNAAIVNQEDIDDVIEGFGQMMHDLLLRTQRPTAVALAKAAQMAWEVSPAVANAFGHKLVEAFSVCRKTAGSTTQGLKLKPGKKQVVMLFKKHARQARGISSPQKARLPIKKGLWQCEEGPFFHPVRGHTGHTAGHTEHRGVCREVQKEEVV